MSVLIAYKYIPPAITLFSVKSCAFKIVLLSAKCDMLSLTNCTLLTANMTVPVTKKPVPIERFSF
jgi:hypothetical protein